MTEPENTHTGVRLVCLDFQAPPQSETPLSHEERVDVSMEAFPRSAPLDVRGGNFRALKVFPAGACIAVSHIFDGGRADEWDRPILSARVALIHPGHQNAWGREMEAVGAALAMLEDERTGSRHGSALVADAIQRNGILSSRERWAEAIRELKIPLEFLARVAHLCTLGSDVVFVAPNPAQMPRLLTLALALVPPSRLVTLRACTCCYNLHAEGREEIVFVVQRPAEKGRDVWARFSGRLGPAERAVIDWATFTAPRMRGSPCGSEVFEAALRELLEAKPWPGLDFPEMHRMILYCLDALLAKREKKLLRTAAEELPKDLVERMSHFLRCGR